MTSNDDASELSKAPSNRITPFSIAAKTTTSSHKPAKNTRNKETRRGVVPPKPKPRKRPTKTSQISNNHSSLVAIPVKGAERPDEVDQKEDAEEGSSKDSTADSTSEVSQTPGPESSVSQAFEPLGKRSRATTSLIHDHINKRDDRFICKRCLKSYSVTGGTGTISRHLKKVHSIDPTLSGVTEKKMRKDISIDAAILRGVEVNKESEEKRRQTIMNTHLDKNTLEYLYL